MIRYPIFERRESGLRETRGDEYGRRSLHGDGPMAQARNFAMFQKSISLCGVSGQAQIRGQNSELDFAIYFFPSLIFFHLVTCAAAILFRAPADAVVEQNL